MRGPTLRASFIAVVCALSLCGSEPANAQTDPTFVDGKPTFRRVDSGDPNVLRSEFDLSLIDEATLRDYAAKRRSVTVQDIRKAMTDVTYRTHDRVHGSQIEYAGADGSTHLLYPGNTVILRGYWQPKQIFVEYVAGGKLIKRYEYSQICVRYGSNTYNPATSHAGDGWECRPFETYRKNIVETKRGDVLKLRTRVEPPFVLSKEDVSLAALRARIRN